MKRYYPNFFSLCPGVVSESEQTPIVSGKTSADLEEKSVEYQAFINDHIQSIFFITNTNMSMFAFCGND